jgi:hypothetical protein
MESVMVGLRLPQEIAVQVAAEASRVGWQPASFCDQIVTAHYESSQADEAASREKGR